MAPHAGHRAVVLDDFDSLLEMDVDHGTRSEKPRQRKRPCALFMPWWFELGSVILSIASFIALVLFLRVYEGRSLSEWTLPLSLNAVLAILSAVFKSSMVMPIGEGIAQLKWVWFARRPRSLAQLDHLDLASKGPWGSVNLIVGLLTREERPYLAAVGATVIVLALAVEPIFQALVQYPSCLRLSNTMVASISRTTYYNASGLNDGINPPTLDQEMQLAIYRGMVSPPRNSSLIATVSCPSGNCTFPHDGPATFSTLAMCHSCADISGTIIRGDNSRDWNFSLPSGAKIDNIGTMVSIADSSKASSLFAFDSLIMTTDKPGCKPSCGIITTDKPGCDPSCAIEPMAIRCDLAPCIKTYGANFTRSVYRETEVSSTPLKTMATDDRGDRNLAIGFSLATDETLRNGVWSACDPTPERTGANTVEIFADNKTTAIGPAAIPPGVDSSTVWYPPDCVWYYGSSSRVAARIMLNNLLAKEKFELIMSTTPQGPTWLQLLYNQAGANLTSVDSFANSLAISMSAQIRVNSADPPDMKATSGEVWENQTCIEVRWPFLSFLVFLLVLELAFCTATFVAWQMSSWREAWKSSALPLLFHGLDETPKDRYRGMGESVESMMRVAKGTKVQLQNGDRGWQLYGD